MNVGALPEGVRFRRREAEDDSPLSSEGNVFPRETRLRRFAMIPAYPSEFARPEEACKGCAQCCPEIDCFEGSVRGERFEESAKDGGGEGKPFAFWGQAVGPEDTP
jgi:hypothetical protein